MAKGEGIELWKAMATQHVKQEELKAKTNADAEATNKLNTNSGVEMLGYDFSKSETSPTKE